MLATLPSSTAIWVEMMRDAGSPVTLKVKGKKFQTSLYDVLKHAHKSVLSGCRIINVPSLQHAVSTLDTPSLIKHAPSASYIR